MTLRYKNSIYRILTLSLCVCLLLLASTVEATSSIYNDISVTSNTGGNTGTQDTGTASVEITHITDNNGTRTTYRYASSSVGSVEHSVDTTPGALPYPLTSNVSATSSPAEILQYLQAILNYLSYYVDTSS